MKQALDKLLLGENHNSKIWHLSLSLVSLLTSFLSIKLQKASIANFNIANYESQGATV